MCLSGPYVWAFGAVAKIAYMVVVGKAAPDPAADFNGNGAVDIGDTAKIAYYFRREALGAVIGIGRGKVPFYLLMRQFRESSPLPCWFAELMKHKCNIGPTRK